MIEAGMRDKLVAIATDDELDPARDRRLSAAGKATLAVGALVLAGALFVSLALEQTVYANVSLHATLEALGAVAALMLAFALLVSRRGEGSRWRVTMAGSGFLAMGLLDTMHAAQPFGESFVWLHGWATLLGGALFALVWLPVRAMAPRWARIIPWLAALAALAVGVAGSVYVSALPAMLDGGRFTVGGVTVNTAGGLLFLVAALRFALLYARSRTIDHLSYTIFCVLVGGAALALAFARFWDIEWWYLHLVRLSAYFILQARVFSLFRKTSITLINSHAELIALVEEKTRDLSEENRKLQRSEEEGRRAMRALRSSESRYRTMAHEQDFLIGSAPFGILFACDGVVIRANPELARLCGYPDSQAMIGLRTEALFHDAGSYVDFSAEVEPQLAENIAIDVEWTLRRTNGSTFTARLAGRALPAEHYEFGAVWMVENITERLVMFDALKTSEMRLRRMMNSSLIGIIQGKMSGTMLDANQVFFDVTGYDQEALDEGSLRWQQLIPLQYHQLHERALEEVRTLGHSTPSERELVRKDGTRIPVLMGLARLEGSSDEWVGFALDLTERQRVDRMKSEFISVVSHELRTPLTSIRGSLALLEGGVIGPLPPAALKLVQVAHRNSQRLVGLINDILDMEKLMSGQMLPDMQPLDLVQLVGQAIEANAAYGAALEVGFVLAAHPEQAMIAADSARLMQVMANLLSNAVKFSPTGGQVTVNIVRVGLLLRIEVKDKGPGIATDFQDRIFEQFAQADSTNTRQQGGTGLGLHITRALVERMDGHIGFETELGLGTTFWIEFMALEKSGAQRALL